MTHSSIVLIASALAVYRLTHLIVEDKIAQPIRDWAVRASNFTMELVTCPWCVSIWFGAGAVLALALIPTVWFYIALWLAFSAIAGFLETH